MDSSPSEKKAIHDDLKNVLAAYRKAPVVVDESDDYESEISEPEDLDRYDSTFVVDDDEIIEESVLDIDEESILSDPSDLFDNQTESEPEPEPEMIYREKKLPNNPLIDFEAVEDDDDDDDDEEDGDDDRDQLIEDNYDPSILDASQEEESDYEGPRKEITGPLNASDFVDEEAEEHNDLAEMYDGIIGHQIISSDEEEEEEGDDLNKTINLESDSDEDEEENEGDDELEDDLENDLEDEENEEECEDDESIEAESDASTEILASSSPVAISPVKAPVVIRKRRRLVVFDSDIDGSSVKKVIRKKRKSEVECVTIDSSFAGDNSVLSTISPLVTCNGTNSVKPVKPRSARQLILDSDDEEEHNEDVENASPKSNCLTVDLNCAFLDPNDTLSSPHVDKW